MSDLQRDLEFLYETGCIRHVQRQWKQFLNPDFANLAEHTFRVIWIALVIAKHEEDVDINKVIKMALVHDLSESRSVDVHYLSRQYVTRQEDQALHDTLADTALEDFEAIYHEYEARECIEAKIVKDADNLEVDLELKEQEYRGMVLGDHWKAMRQDVGEKRLYTQTAKALWRAIQDSNPHDWHLNGRNRFTSGDWKK